MKKNFSFPLSKHLLFVFNCERGYVRCWPNILNLVCCFVIISVVPKNFAASLLWHSLGLSERQPLFLYHWQICSYFQPCHGSSATKVTAESKICRNASFILLFLKFSFVFFPFSEEIRGEILFVLYKISILQYADKDDAATDVLYPFCPKLLQLSLETLVKTQSDDVRLNCVGQSTISKYSINMFSL